MTRRHAQLANATPQPLAQCTRLAHATQRMLTLMCSVCALFRESLTAISMLESTLSFLRSALPSP
eukprot:3704344-Amphidinium_carterae.2